MKIAVSSCLLGDNVRFDGTNKRNEEIISLLDNHEIIKFCPEIIVFNVPREPIEIKNNKAYTRSGKDVTKQLKNASNKCFEIIKDCDLVILKSKSPSCGYQKIYDGTFSKTLIDGNGLLTKLCIENKMKLFTELDIEKIKNELNKK